MSQPRGLSLRGPSEFVAADHALGNSVGAIGWPCGRPLLDGGGAVPGRALILPRVRSRPYLVYN